MLLNIITWSKSCVIFQANRVATFGITDAKCYFSVVTLSTQDNAKLLEYQTKVTTKPGNKLIFRHFT